MPTENILDMFNLTNFDEISELYNNIESKCQFNSDILNNTNNKTKSEFIRLLFTNINSHSIYNNYIKNKSV